MIPTPNQIIESKDEIDLDLYNFLEILVRSKPPFEKDVVELTPSKTLKKVKICKDIESLMPSRKLSLSQVPSNMDSCKLVTHAVDNIDWENKSLNGDQTHHTNSIIIQESTDSRNDIPSVALNPDYNFQRSEHKSFKGTQFNLLNIIFKRSETKLL